MRIIILLFGLLFLASCKENTTIQNTATESHLSDLSQYRPGMEVIQFHSEHRCQTCLKIEEDIQATLAEYGDIPFRLVNVEDPQNLELSRKFEAAGTAIFLYDPKTDEMIELTDFAFMNAFDSHKFKMGFQTAISQF